MKNDVQSSSNDQIQAPKESSSVREGSKVYDRCYICGKWWWQETMVMVPVPDQSGTVKKPVCGPCYREIEERSYAEKG